jgi:hypothetical protein
MPVTAAPKQPTQQDVCIDLPGETVQSWRSSDNIKVILRKHRDVIFDLNLGRGTYTIQATQENFYNARDKKLVQAKHHEVVTFKDGERLHLWVPRNFQGALVLKSGSEILMKLVPSDVDTHQYDDAPTTKPAPIIVAIGSGTNTAATSNMNIGVRKSPRISSSLPTPVAAPTDEQCSIICVVDGKIKDMPAIIGRHFKQGGGKSGLVEIDPNEVATRNWIWGQVTGAIAYTSDNSYRYTHL